MVKNQVFSVKKFPGHQRTFFSKISAKRCLTLNNLKKAKKLKKT